MRSLSLKLILAFLAVSLIGVALLAIIASQRTAYEFAQYTFAKNQEGFVSQLSEYYRIHGTWIGFEESLHLAETVDPGRVRGMPRARGVITLIDHDGNIVIAGFGHHVGDQATQAEITNALPIEVDGQEVGRLIISPGAFRENRADAAFLDRVNRAVLLSALGAMAAALLLGVILARTLTRPLRELTDATRAVAEGNLERRVPVRSSDELGELAASFNQMSADLARSRDLRRQMTADIAHELRTPISVILGHAEAVHDGVLPPSLETLDIIREEANRLERLVEDLRTLSMADAGELPLTCHLVSPLALLKQSASAHRPYAKKKNVELRVDASSNLPEISVDPDRMTQVLGNLISNALRYTPQNGSITITAARVPDGIEIRVQDNGPGIEHEKLPHIFDRFYRTDQSRQRDSGGSGLGLAIAKSIVESHSGRIWAESQLGEGTTIVVQLPDTEKRIVM